LVDRSADIVGDAFALVRRILPKLRELLQQHHDASAFGKRCADLAHSLADRNHHSIPDGLHHHYVHGQFSGGAIFQI
jgi:hypothetical protein